MYNVSSNIFCLFVLYAKLLLFFIIILINILLQEASKWILKDPA